METVFDRIKNLADSRGKSIVDVEADLGLSKNYLYKWKKSAPNSTKLIEVADYFNVSTDYLLGRKENQDNKSFKKNSGVDDRPKLQKIARKATKLDDKQLDQLNDVMDAVFKDIFGGESYK